MSKVSLLVKETPDTNIYPVSGSVRDVCCLHHEVHDIFVLVALMPYWTSTLSNKHTNNSFTQHIYFSSGKYLR